METTTSSLYIKPWIDSRFGQVMHRVDSLGWQITSRDDRRWRLQPPTWTADERIELITANRASDSVSVFQGSIQAGFTSTDFSVGRGLVDLAIGNLNSDAFADVFVLDAESNAVWAMPSLGNGSLGTPLPIPLGDRPTAFAVGRINGDSFDDLAVALSSTNRILLLQGNEQGHGQPIYVSTPGQPSDVAFTDLNADSLMDLIVAISDRDKVSIHFGQADGRYSLPQEIQVGDGPERLSIQDIDRDGRLDILVGNRGDDTGTLIYNRFDPSKIYHYPAKAVDPDGDAITYRLVDGPGGMLIHSDSGAIAWSASLTRLAYTASSLRLATLSVLPLLNRTK